MAGLKVETVLIRLVDGTFAVATDDMHTVFKNLVDTQEKKKEFYQGST